MKFPGRVKIVEVGPRDGLQNEKNHVSIDLRVELINQLSKCGFSVIEAGSFVSPKWVPQMKDTDLVFRQIVNQPNISYPVLVPNQKGLGNALEAGVEEIAIFGAATEDFSFRNINCSIKDSINKFKPLAKTALDAGLKVRGYISVVLGCPISGEVDPFVVAAVAEELLEMGCYEISLGDTIGTGTPRKTTELLEVVTKKVPSSLLAGHFHDTYGQALANILASLDFGIASFDASVSGLGGCPFAGNGASGNVATEDVIYMLNGMSVETGIDIDKLVEVGEFICEKLKRPNASKAGKAIRNKKNENIKF